MTDIPRPRSLTIFKGDVANPGKRLLPRVGTGYRCPPAIEVVGNPRSIIPCRVQGLDHRQIGISTLDLVGHTAFEQIVSVILDGYFGIAHALGEVL